MVGGHGCRLGYRERPLWWSSAGGFRRGGFRRSGCRRGGFLFVRVRRLLRNGAGLRRAGEEHHYRTADGQGDNQGEAAQDNEFSPRRAQPARRFTGHLGGQVLGGGLGRGLGGRLGGRRRLDRPHRSALPRRSSGTRGATASEFHHGSPAKSTSAPAASSSSAGALTTTTSFGPLAAAHGSKA